MERQEAEENCLYDFILMPSELQTAFMLLEPIFKLFSDLFFNPLGKINFICKLK